MIKLADTLAPMADFPAVMAEHTEFADGESLQEKLDNGSLGGDGASYKQLSQAEYDALTDDEKMDGREYRTYDTGHIYKLGIEYGKEDAIYTSLADLGLTAPVTVGDIFNAMDDKTIVMIACEGTKYHITDIPGYYGILTIKRAKLGRFSIEFQSSSAVSATDVKRWIGTLKGTDGTELTWKLISTQTTYVALSDMELTAEATVQDVIDALPIGCTALLRTDEFTNWSTLFNDIQYGYLKIEKTVNGLSNIELQEVISPNRRYFGTQVGGNFDKWQKPIDQFYGIITQEKDGYFKFKPCSDPKTQGIRITATDNYGGMIDISGVAPTQTQYKPFKCVRLSHGTYTDYNASNPTSNKMEKLFFLNGYMYLKIVAYTTVTFTNLIEEPTFVETIEEGAEEIPIRSVFDIPYNDGYADPSIIVIGDTNSDNGVIKTLDTLGFTKDIMTWDTGVYRVSHVSGLTGLPSDITNATPSFRLEHHNIKKWGNGHNPSKSTLAQRHSIIYCDNGNIYQRFYTSGATAGVLTTDTGWRCITQNTKGLVSNAQNFKLDITKNHASWYGFFKLEYLYGTELCQVDVGIANTIDYKVTKGTNHIDKITYTVNGANIVLGVDFIGKVYGVQVVEMPSEFGTINSLTAETYAGDTTANLKLDSARTYTTLAELGLTADATPSDIVRVLPIGGKALISTHEFTNYQTLFPYSDETDKHATFSVDKGNDIYGSRTIVTWVRKDGAKVVYGGINSSNQVVWWNEYVTKDYVDSKIADLQAQINALK